MSSRWKRKKAGCVRLWNAAHVTPSKAAMFWLACCAIVLLGCGTGAGTPARTPDQAVRVVASFSILADWVVQVGGDRVQVTTLVGPQADAHTYEPTPRDVVSIASADLVFEIGLGFENWLGDLCQRAEAAERRCVVTRGVKPRMVFASSGDNEADPHVWQSPRNAIAIVRVIAEELTAIDPANEHEYTARANAYVRELERLHQDILVQVATLAGERRKLVTTHDTFGYFADEYGFEVASVLGAATSEVADPSAGNLAAVVDHVRGQGVRAVFAENILTPELTAQVAREAGVVLVPSLYTDALGLPDSPGGDYLSMMRFNVQTIVEALR